MSQRPFWSVIIPVKGRTKYLPASLGSVLCQDPGLERMEILLIENPTETGDYPASAEVERIAKGRPIRHLTNLTDRGLYGSINQAVAASNGRWIHVLHDDDWVQPFFYYRLRGGLESTFGVRPGVGFTRYINVHEDHRIWGPPEFNPGEQGPEFLNRILGGNPLQMCAVAFSRDHFEEVGPFNEALPYCADWEWYIRSFLKAPWWHVADSLARYRVHSSNLSHSDRASGLAEANINAVLESIPALLFEAIRQ